MSNYEKEQIDTLITVIQNLKPNEVLEIPYLDDATNVQEEPFNSLFPNDVVRIEIDKGDIIWSYIPAHDLVHNSCYSTLEEELSSYTWKIINNLKDKKLQEKYPTTEEFAKHVDRMLWDSSCFQDGCNLDNTEDLLKQIEEFERLHVDIANFKIVTKEV